MLRLFSVLVAASLITAPTLVHADAVTIKGSDTMVVLVQRWAEEFMKKNPTAKLQVTGGGSGVGIAALVNGTTDIAMASRAMKPAEKEKLRARTKTAPVEISTAKDGVTFYLNEKNPVAALTLAQLRGIFLGEIKNWKEVGGSDQVIALYSRENSSGTYVFVKEELLKNEDFPPQTQTLPGTAAVASAVSKEPRGIGYGGVALAKGVKELKIKVGSEEIAPTLESVRAGKYPLSRDLYFYVAANPTGVAKTFIDFCLSAEGQAIVTKAGYFPLK